MKKKSILFFISFAVLSVAFAAVRYFECLNSIDFVTGFYHNGSGTLFYLMMTLAFVFYAAITIFPGGKRFYYFKKRMGQIDCTECFMLGIIMLICAAAYLWEAVLSAIDKSGVFELAYLGLGVLGFGLIGSVLIVRKRITLGLGFLCTLPAMMYILRAVNIFMHHLVITAMSDMLIRLLADLSMGVVYLALGRIFIRNEAKLSRMKVNTLGFFAATVVMAESIGKTIYWVTLSSNMRNTVLENKLQLAVPTASFVMDGVMLVVLLYFLHKLPFRKAIADER